MTKKPHERDVQRACYDCDFGLLRPHGCDVRRTAANRKSDELILLVRVNIVRWLDKRTCEGETQSESLRFPSVSSTFLSESLVSVPIRLLSSWKVGYAGGGLNSLWFDIAVTFIPLYIYS